MPARPLFQMRTTLNVLLQTLAFSAMALAFVSAPAQAAKRHGVEVQKQSSPSAKRRITRTFIVAKRRTALVRVAAVPGRPSFGQLAGLHSTQDQLDLKSSVALVIDQDTREVLLSKN